MNRIACALAWLVAAWLLPAGASGEPLQPARQVTFPASGLTLQLPPLPSKWQLAPRSADQVEAFLERDRPGAPALGVSFVIDGTRRSRRCEEPIQAVKERATLQPKPDFLPAGYYPTVARDGEAMLLCADANGMLATVVFEYGGDFGSEDLKEVVPVLEAVRAMLASAPPAAAAAKGTAARLGEVNLTVQLPEGWKHVGTNAGNDELLFSVPGRPTVKLMLFAKYMDGRDCDWVLAQTGSEFEQMPATEYVKRWHPRGRIFGGKDSVGMMFCAEPRKEQFVRAVVLLEGDFSQEQQTVAALTPMSALLDSIMAEIEHAPDWRAPFRGPSTLTLPKAGIQVAVGSGAEWELIQDAPGEVLIRVRPVEHRIKVLVAARGTLTADRCQAYIDQAAGKAPGQILYSPAYLPAGWNPRVFEFRDNDLAVVCGGDASGRMVTVFPTFPDGASASDLADLKAMLEAIAVGFGIPGAGSTAAAPASPDARPAWASASSSNATVTIPAPPAAGTTNGSSVYEPPSLPVEPSYDGSFIDPGMARLGQLRSIWFAGGSRSGGRMIDGVYGGVVGNDRLYLHHREPVALRLSGWLGYGLNGLAGDGALAVGAGPSGDDWALLALAGVGVSRLGADLYPAAFVGHGELRGRLLWDGLGVEGAVGLHSGSGYAGESVRFDLRLYFALGREQTWMLSWRRAMYDDFDYDLLLLGFGLPD